MTVENDFNIIKFLLQNSLIILIIPRIIGMYADKNSVNNDRKIIFSFLQPRSKNN